MLQNNFGVNNENAFDLNAMYYHFVITCNVYANREDVLEYHTNGKPHITVYYEINKDGELEHRKRVWDDAVSLKEDTLISQSSSNDEYLKEKIKANQKKKNAFQSILKFLFEE